MMTIVGYKAWYSKRSPKYCPSVSEIMHERAVISQKYFINANVPKRTCLLSYIAIF